MPIRKYNQSVLISGASSGIGKITACTLAKVGFDVFAGVRTEEAANQLKQQHDNIEPVLLDITDADSIQMAYQHIEDKVGSHGLYGLINNAGTVLPGPLEFLPLDHLRKQFEVNVFGTVALTQMFLPLLRQASTQRPRIINVGSASGLMTDPLSGAYGASKAAVGAISDCLRWELTQANIKVISIEPGIIATPIWDKSIKAAKTFEQQYPEAMNYYADMANRVYDIIDDVLAEALPAEKVANTIITALTSKRPKAHYRIGKEAIIKNILARFVPYHWIDWLVIKMIGSKKSGKGQTL